MSGFAVLHMETNGLAPARGGRVFELALVRVENGSMTASHHSLMNPGLPLPPFLTTLTGITPSMIRAAPSSAAVMGELAAFLGDGVLVTHNASLERLVWQQELALAGCSSPASFLCMLRLARRLYPWASSQKLAALAALQGFTPPALHKRALHMAQVKAQIFLRMQSDLAALYPGETIDAGFLDRYQRSGRALIRAQPQPS